LLHELVLLAHSFILFLLLLELNLALVLLKFPLLGEQIHLLLQVALDQVLTLTHLCFKLLHLARLFVELLKNLKEDPLAFTTLSLSLGNTAKSYSEFIAEVD
jgi:hypothetical protein